MASLKDVQRKIGAVKKTRQITRAMNMVAAAKLRNAQTRMESFNPYASKFSEVLGNLASRLEPDIHPLLREKETVSTVELMHFTADRGLCGNFNSVSTNKASRWIRDQEAKGRNCSLTCVGKKGRDYFNKRGYTITSSHTYVYGEIDVPFVNQIADGFIHRYLEDEVDAVYMVFTRFFSMARQEPELVKLIPIETPEQAEALPAVEYLCEPTSEEVLAGLLPKYISVQIMNAFLQTETSEHVARMTAMDQATKNCNDMIDNLTQLYNKARQAAITSELMDIVGGAEALRSA